MLQASKDWSSPAKLHLARRMHFTQLKREGRTCTPKNRHALYTESDICEDVRVKTRSYHVWEKETFEDLRTLARDPQDRGQSGGDLPGGALNQKPRSPTCTITGLLADQGPISSQTSLYVALSGLKAGLKLETMRYFYIRMSSKVFQFAASKGLC